VIYRDIYFILLTIDIEMLILLLTTEHPSEIFSVKILSVFSLHVFKGDNIYTPHKRTTIRED